MIRQRQAAGSSRQRGLHHSAVGPKKPLAVDSTAWPILRKLPTSDSESLVLLN